MGNTATTTSEGTPPGEPGTPSGKDRSAHARAMEEPPTTANDENKGDDNDPRKADGASLGWSGEHWEIRTQRGGPTANGAWNANNVSVDANGGLHLKISRSGDRLSAAEVRSQLKGRGYGTYTFEVGSRVDGFAPNVVAGFFLYDVDDPSYGYRELDVEASRWGKSTSPVLWSHTRWMRDDDSETLSEIAAGDESETVHQIVWRPDGITWISSTPDGRVLARSDSSARIPPGNEQVMINLWLYDRTGWQQTPTTEVIVRSFRYEPLG